MLSDIIANPTKYKRQYDEQLIKKSKEEMAEVYKINRRGNQRR